MCWYLSYLKINDLICNMDKIISITDHRLRTMDNSVLTVKRTAVFLGCLWLSFTENITNIPLLMFMYHVYHIFNNYVDDNAHAISYYI